MAGVNSDTDPGQTSMFLQKSATARSPVRSEPSSRRNSTVKANLPVSTTETITVKDFFDFMKTAYQVYEHLDGEDEGTKINWEELTKLTVLNHVIEQQERDLLHQTAFTENKAVISKSDTAIEKDKHHDRVERKYSCSEIELKSRGRRCSLPPEAKVEMLGVWTETNLNCKLNDVINEGILDSILPYLVGYKKASKTTSVYVPIIKKPSSNTSSEVVRKPASFQGFVNEKESRDRLGRRKSSIIAAQERLSQKQDGDVEIHVCDEVKGLKKDFRCPQKLLVSKMGYFADVTAGQRLEDMDISVHCDIQIFDWLMRWVKRDSILVADWPLLEPGNVVPILVSASFLQMEPLLHDCLIYCHAHMNDIVKTSTNLACLSDALLTRLAAMYTNVELEAVRDRKDKLVSRLFCKLILSLAEPVPETLRGHHATLATLFKCSKCNKLLGRHIAEQVPCQPSSMRIDRRGNVISTHTRDPSWDLSEYISWLYGELRSWRRVYWRLWAEAHFLRCQLCEAYFPVYQMEWCSYHEQGPQMFGLEGRPPLPAGRYPCCGERAYRFETISRNTGCQFREHVPDDRQPAAAAVLDVCGRFRDVIAMRPPELVFPERLTRLLTREPNKELNSPLQCEEVFWWEGIQLMPPRQPLGLLGKLYTSNTKFNLEEQTANARPGSPVAVGPVRTSAQTLAAATGVAEGRPERPEPLPPPPPTKEVAKVKQGTQAAAGEASAAGDASEDESSESSDCGSEGSEDSAPSEEEAPRPRQMTRQLAVVNKRTRVTGRQWIASLSARSNQDGQRRFEERAARQMRAALARRAPPAPPRVPATPPGGVYARLEAEWRDRHVCAPRGRAAASARPRPQIKYKA